MRLTVTGLADPTFLANANGAVVAIRPQSNGTIYVAGQFGNIGGGVETAVARLTSTGLLDPTFDPNFDSCNVNTLEVQPNGKVLVG